MADELAADVDELWQEYEADGCKAQGGPAGSEPASSGVRSPGAQPATDPSLTFPSITIPDLTRLEIKKRPALFVLHGHEEKVVLRERDYGMLFAERGIGKTWWSLACALALAGGGRAAFLKAARPRRVVYVDGEMPLEDMRDRINALLRGMSDQEIVQASMNFTLVNRDLHEELFLPSLTSDVGRDDWAAWLESKAPDLVVLDNISSLTSGSIENNEEDWAPIGKWAVHQRRQRAVAWVHHASRGGTARGTSKREDPMDFVWKLRGVESQETGALVTLHWDKGRNVVDNVLEDRMLQLSTDGPKEAPISVWNEVPKADGIVREMDQRERNMIPIAEAIFRRNTTIGKKEFRAQCREIYKDKYGRGIENTVIDRLYGGRDQWEAA